MATVPSIRLRFDIESVAAAGDGWRLEGEPGYHPRHWARPGERFTMIGDERSGSPERVQAVELVVTELTGSSAVVSGTGGELLKPGDELFGERFTEVDPAAGPELAAVLGLPPSESSADWSAVETALGVTLPGDYKRFVGAYGAGLVDDHLVVCGPGEPHDLLENVEWARACVRLDFGASDLGAEQWWPGGPDQSPGDWRLGDPAHWTPGRQGVPAWFRPGDDLIAWGSTGNGDMLCWHVPDSTGPTSAGPEEWVVVLKEEGPYWERFEAGFDATVAGLLTGDLQSEYLSRWFGGPHSYTR